MIDLHCHLLPGVDDGSKSVEQSVQVLTVMRDGGVTAVCLTPHFSVRQIPRGLPHSHEEAFAALRAQAPEGIALHRGVELMLDRPVRRELLEHSELTLGGTRYILVEFTRMVAVAAMVNALRQVVELGLVPVVAHPERYAGCRPSAIRRLKAVGALMQVDATTLLGARGRGQRARELVANGLADLIAADNHGDDRLMNAPCQFLREQGGQEQADLLARRNPAAILANEDPEPVPPLEIKTHLLDRLRQLLSGDEL
ncbi:MAG: tyrosine-protein phosphatase [Gemmatimonadales bacterium]